MEQGQEVEREPSAHGQGSQRRREAAPMCHEGLSQFYRFGKGALEMQDGGVWVAVRVGARLCNS